MHAWHVSTLARTPAPFDAKGLLSRAKKHAFKTGSFVDELTRVGWGVLRDSLSPPIARIELWKNFLTSLEWRLHNESLDVSAAKSAANLVSCLAARVVAAHSLENSLDTSLDKPADDANLYIERTIVADVAERFLLATGRKARTPPRRGGKAVAKQKNAGISSDCRARALLFLSCTAVLEDEHLLQRLTSAVAASWPIGAEAPTTGPDIRLARTVLEAAVLIETVEFIAPSIRLWLAQWIRRKRSLESSDAVLDLIGVLRCLEIAGCEIPGAVVAKLNSDVLMDRLAHDGQIAILMMRRKYSSTYRSTSSDDRRILDLVEQPDFECGLDSDSRSFCARIAAEHGKRKTAGRLLRPVEIEDLSIFGFNDFLISSERELKHLRAMAPIQNSSDIRLITSNDRGEGDWFDAFLKKVTEVSRRSLVDAEEGRLHVPLPFLDDLVRNLKLIDPDLSSEWNLYQDHLVADLKQDADQAQSKEELDDNASQKAAVSHPLEDVSAIDAADSRTSSDEQSHRHRSTSSEARRHMGVITAGSPKGPFAKDVGALVKKYTAENFDPDDMGRVLNIARTPDPKVLENKSSDLREIRVKKRANGLLVPEDPHFRRIMPPWMPRPPRSAGEFDTRFRRRMAQLQREKREMMGTAKERRNKESQEAAYRRYVAENRLNPTNAVS